MSDWQNYATEPKRETLLESLQALVEQPLPPPDQAERLKALRQQWNDLGPLRRTDRTLQKRFDAMAEQAFAPCKTYFAEQSERRKANLQKRQAVCEQLAELVEKAIGSKFRYKKLRPFPAKLEPSGKVIIHASDVA